MSNGKEHVTKKTQGHEIDRPLKEKFQCWHANSQYFEPVVKKRIASASNTILDTTRVLPPEEITDHFDEFNTNLKKAESILQTEEEQHSSIYDKRDVTKGHLALTIEDGILPAALPECGKQEFKLTTVAATSNTDFVNQVSQQCYILHSTILLHHFCTPTMHSHRPWSLPHIHFVKMTLLKPNRNRQNLFEPPDSRLIHTGTLLFILHPKSLTETEQCLTLNHVALPVTIVTHLLPFHPFSPCLLSGATQTLAAAGLGNRDPSPLYSPPAVSLPTTIPFLSSISIDFANFCSTNIDTSPASALPLSSITSYPITLLDEYPSLSSFLHIHSTIILFSLLHPSVPLHQSIKSKADDVDSIGLHTLPPLLQAMTLLRHLILFSPPHTIKQLQDSAYHCGAMDWLHFGACSPPVAITQPRSQEKEDTSWMSTSIAAEANAVGSSAAPHIRDSCRDLFFLLSSPASIEHYLIPSFRRASPTPTVVHRPPSPHKRLVPFVNRHLCAMPPSFPLLHPINLADIHLSPFYEPAHVTSTSLTWHEPTYLLSPFILPPSSFWAMSSLDFFSHNMSPSANSNPHTRHTNGWDTPESPSEQTKDDPQHTTQHPLPNPFRAHSDDTVKWTAEDADRSGRDLGDPLSLADWDRAMSQAKKDGLDVKEGENMSKLHYFEHTATTFLHTLIRDNIPAHPHPRQNTERAEREGRSFQTRQVNSQALEVAVKRGHSLLSIVGRMVKEATLTKYGCGEKSSWLEALLESERELGCLPIPFLPINSGAFWAMFDPQRLRAPSQARSSIPAGHPPACADSLPPATRVHVFAVAREGGRVLHRRADGGERPCPLPRQSALCRERSAERPPALSAEQLEATPAAPHIDTMRGIDDCSQFAISLFAVSNPLLLAEELMKRIRCLGRLFGYLEQGLADQSVSLIHTIQRTAAGRESSEQFAEHAEFELLVIDYCVKICTTSFVLIYTLIHSSKLACSPSKTRTASRCLMTPSRPICSAAEDPIPVPLVSISRIESALSHPISFPKAHCVIVSLGSLIPLFASNQIFPLSIGPRSFLYQNQINRYNRSATTKDNFDVLNHLFKVFLRHAPLSLASLPFAPTKATLTRIAKLNTSASSPDAREDVKMEMSVLIKRMSQYAERKHAREKKWNRLASFHSQNRHSRQSGCAVCTAMIQLWKEESADFETTRASLYLHLNTAIKLKQRPPNSFCNMQSVVGRWNVIKTSADADFDETKFRDERVSSFILSSHDNTLDLHGNPITHTKRPQKTPQTRARHSFPVQCDGRSQVRVATPQADTHHFPVHIDTDHHSTSSQHAGHVPRLGSRPVSQRCPSEAEEGQATDLTTQLQDEEDDENFDAMDEFRQFSLQKSFGGRGSEWGGASSGGRGGHFTNLFSCFPLSIPPHADAQKTNDMAFPPSTRLKMHKEEVDLVSAVKYVCMITDLLLKDDMVTFDDTTRSGSVSPYSKLSTSSPAASSPRLPSHARLSVCVDADEHSDATERTSSSPQTMFRNAIACLFRPHVSSSFHPSADFSVSKSLALALCGTVALKSSSFASQTDPPPTSEITDGGRFTVQAFKDAEGAKSISSVVAALVLVLALVS
ncbi:hypothetical protein BLNAU_21129 [Blattamonas nauphoetae]|uniref:Uncharacterized protein n=1 Tax=Blattamonas nauphoetae TaxID=2049346 RepID=A0ABQ9WXE6_9EUKA|nr:hypothetical protein BLNAU_21129 [Blattamonas nauphoetae]